MKGEVNPLDEDIQRQHEVMAWGQRNYRCLGCGKTFDVLPDDEVCPYCRQSVFKKEE